MASSSYEVGASSSSLSAPGYTGEWEHDVFVCFRGKDTRGIFTSHLAGHLDENGIRVFTDDMLERTEDIAELLSILSKSAISVVIFSENFADSSYCLDEVAIIKEGMDNFGHQVLPVFYRVTPEDVSDDSGTYASVIDTTHKPNLDQKKRWMDALKKVVERGGRTSNEINDDYKLCKTIVEDVLKKLVGMSSSGKFSNLVGMDTRMLKVQQLLAMDDDTSNDARVIGFWGMGGLGKTTLATALYQMLTSPTNRIKHHFFVNVKASEVEEQVQELYSTLLSQNNLSLVDLGVDHRRKRLSRLKVVVVFDNVETPQQLEKLLLGEILDPAKLFGPGSVIIITSRNRGVLNHAKAEIHNVEAFDSSESLKLFDMHAFRQRCAPVDLKHLSSRIVSYCKGNPLAIKVLGGTLFGKDKEYWKSFLSRLENIPNPEIHDVLIKSYDVLEREERSLFMDVACFPFDATKDRLTKYLATSYKSAYSLVDDLINKSLLASVLSNNEGHEVIVVHDLLKEMAWNIVKAEPILSRLKNAFKGGKAIQSLDLDLSKAKKELRLAANAFEGMDSLRLLGIYQGSKNLVPDKLRLVDERLDTLPNELGVLQWAGFPSRCLPETFDPEKLTILDLCHSQIEMCWEGVQPSLVHLIKLELSYCLNLRAIPNLSVCKQLENLLLKGCKRLVELPPCVQYLDKLVELDLSDCTNLKCLPGKLNSKYLEYFYLSNCPNVALCPEINSSEVGLQVLDLEETPVRELPSAIHKVKEGGTLRLCGKHIISFPRISTSLKLFRLCHTTITKMDVRDDDCSSSELLLPKFDLLELVENSQLVSLSSNIWDAVKYKLLVDGSPLIESLPDISYPVNDLTEVCIHFCGNLKSFPSGINHLKSVQTILFIGTAMKSLPSSIHLLDNLRYLYLPINRSLESIPDNIHQLAKLKLLSLTCCIKIRYLPQLLPPELKYLILSECKSLQALPTNIGKLNLRRLEFVNCPQLDYKSADKIVADFHSRAMISPEVQSDVMYSGSELPQWYSSNGSGANCEIELPPPPSANNELATGIAFGVVFSLDTTGVGLQMECDVVIECTTVATFRSSPFLIQNESGVASSDYVFLWFDKKLSGETKERMEEEEEEEVPWYVKYAGGTLSFRAHTVPDSEKYVEGAKKIKLKRFGVSLLY